MPEFYTWTILLEKNQWDEIDEKQLSVFGSGEGPNLPLNAHSSLRYNKEYYKQSLDKHEQYLKYRSFLQSS